MVGGYFGHLKAFLKLRPLLLSSPLQRRTIAFSFTSKQERLLRPSTFSSVVVSSSIVGGAAQTSWGWPSFATVSSKTKEEEEEPEEGEEAMEKRENPKKKKKKKKGGIGEGEEDGDAGMVSDWDGVVESDERVKKDIKFLSEDLRKMESMFRPGDIRIGMACLRLAQMYDSIDADPRKVLRYGERALRIMGHAEESSVEGSMENSIEVSAESSIESSVKSSIKSSVEDSIEGSIEVSIERSVETSDETSDKTSHKSSVELSIEGSFDAATCLQVIGSAYYKLEQFEECEAHLQKAVKMTQTLVGNSDDESDIRRLKHAIQFLLGHAKMALGEDELALSHYLESVAINERLLEPGNPELAISYQQVAEACLEMEYFKEAQSLCEKAIAILLNFYGTNSTQVAIARRLLVTIYGDMEEYERLLEENEKLKLILKVQGRTRELLTSEWTTSQALMALERFEEAIEVLESIFTTAEERSPLQGQALVSLADAHLELGDPKESAKLAEKAHRYLSKGGGGGEEGISPPEVGTALLELATVFQKLNDADRSITLIKESISVFQAHPDEEESQANAESELGMLLLFKGEVKEGYRSLAKAAETLERLFGAGDDRVPRLYHHMGCAKLELEKPEEAVAILEKAKQLAVDSLGPDHEDTVAVYTSLVNAYCELERFDKAIQHQKYIVDTLRFDGADGVDNAERKLELILQEAKAKAKAKAANDQPYTQRSI